jgi:hypothetical protein
LFQLQVGKRILVQGRVTNSQLKLSAHSLFGANPSGGFGNHLAHMQGAYGMLGRPPSQNSAAYGMPPSSSASAYGGLGTLSAAASQAASLGINPASE